MANDQKTNLERKATILGQLSRIDLPSFPSLPDSFIKRFPELAPYQEQVRKYSENLNQALSKLSSPKQ